METKETSGEFKLQNGMDVFYKFIPSTQIATVQVWIKTGSAAENSANNGVSHFLEHLVFKGTANYAPDEIDETVESNGGMMNAGTSKDYTTYYITIPVTAVETAFSVLSDMVFRASFIPEEIEKEKPVVVQEIRRAFDNPTHDMFKALRQDLFHGTSYAMEIIGTQGNVEGFTSEILKDYYRTYYTPNNMTLVVIGDVRLETVQELAGKYFEEHDALAHNIGQDARDVVGFPIIKHNGANPKDLEFSEESKPQLFHKDVSVEYSAFAWKLPNINAAHGVYFDIFSELFSGGEFSILNKFLKYEKASVVSVSASDMLNRHYGAFLIYIVTDPNKFVNARADLYELLEIIASGGIDAEDLEKAKNRLKSRKVFEQERCSREAQEIGYYSTLDLKNNYFDYELIVDSVTLEDMISLTNIFRQPARVYRTCRENQ